MDNRDGHVDESIYLSVTVKDNQDGSREISHNITPLIINSANETRYPDEKKSIEICGKMDKYSKILADETILRKHYFRLCKEQMKDFLLDFYYLIAKKEFSSIIKYIHVHFRTKAHTNWMKGFFTFGKF